MPNGKDSPLSPEQVRQQVDQIMDRWQSYASFAALLNALMDANGLGASNLGKNLAGKGLNTHHVNIRQYRHGKVDPPYNFLQTLLETNVLNLDPRRIQPANGEQSAGDQRVALFTAAGLIEVTPLSIRDWNQEVLAGHRRLLESDAVSPRPRWGDLMAKLLSFHLQGGRLSHPQLAARLRDAHGKAIFPYSQRLTALLNNKCIPSKAERLALAHYVGLDDSHIASIEDGIESGAIPMGFARRQNLFTGAFIPIMDKLAAQGVTQLQVALSSAQQAIPGGSVVTGSELSMWRHGRIQPTLPKLRTFAAALRQFGPNRLRDPVTPADLDHLIAAGGFRPDQLTATTHDIIARINEDTRIKPLLRDLQSAVDTSLQVEEVHRRGTALGYDVPTVSVLIDWERSGGTTYPSGQQIRDLLHLYNHLIREKGFSPLSEEETSKVVAVADAITPAGRHSPTRRSWPSCICAAFGVNRRRHPSMERNTAADLPLSNLDDVTADIELVPCPLSGDCRHLQ